MTICSETTTSHRQMTLKERQRQERAALILQAAEDVIAEKGYHDTSIDEIAARVGIAKGTVYLHFPSKDDLVVALCEREMDVFLRSVQQVTQENASARTRLSNILGIAYGRLEHERTPLFLILFSSASVRRTLFEKRETLRHHVSHLAALVGGVLEEGKAAGEFDATIPTPIMVATFLGLLSPRGYVHFLSDTELSPSELGTYIGRIFFNGIVASTST